MKPFNLIRRPPAATYRSIRVIAAGLAFRIYLEAAAAGQAGSWRRSGPALDSGRPFLSSSKYRSLPAWKFGGATRETSDGRKQRPFSFVSWREIQMRLFVAAPRPAGVEASGLAGKAVGKTRQEVAFCSIRHSRSGRTLPIRKINKVGRRTLIWYGVADFIP